MKPYGENVDKNFNAWIEENRAKGRIFTEEEMEWLVMMKKYFVSFREINITAINQTPFIAKGGIDKAYGLFGQDLNKILEELNEKLS